MMCSLRTSSVKKAIAAAAGTTVEDRCGPALIYLRQQGIFTSVYEIKLDEYRAIAVKSEGKLNLYSRRRNSFNRQYHLVYEALELFPITRPWMERSLLSATMDDPRRS